MNDHPTPITEEEARARGYNALTDPIDPVSEAYMIDNFVADMKRGGIPHVLVTIPNKGIEVWRKPNSL